MIELRDGNRWKSLQAVSTWNINEEDSSIRTLEDLLVVEAEQAFELASTESYSNFEIEFEAKTAAGNQFRITYRDGGPSNSFSMPERGTKDAISGAYKESEWNRYRIRVHNDRHQVWMNNRYVSDTAGNEDKAVDTGKISENTEPTIAAETGGPVRLILDGTEFALVIRNARIRKL